ncbi:MAG: 30S ribosomal protein S13 [Thermoplasmatota archaeon]
MAENPNPDFKYIVRIANTDLKGEQEIEPGLANIKGIGIRTAGIIATKAGVPRYGKVGDLTDAQIAKLADLVAQLPENAPHWMLNRVRDLESGEDTHVIGAELEGKKRDDLNRLKKIQAYRGVRHATGQKVRGQRSRSNGRTGLTVGVIKQKIQEGGAKKEEKE